MKTDRATILRIAVFVLLVMVAISVPDLLGLELWVGLILAPAVAVAAAFALGLARGR